MTKMRASAKRRWAHSDRGKDGDIQELLLTASTSEYVDVRQWALDILTAPLRLGDRVMNRYGDRRLAPLLVRALEDSDGGVRRRAATGLGWLQDADAVDPLVDALSDPDVDVRHARRRRAWTTWQRPSRR
jgi:HEAT repeat protein